MNFKLLDSAFQKLGNIGDPLQNIDENTRSTSESLMAGGDLYEKINELVEHFEGIKEGKGTGDLGVKNALAVAIVSPALEGLGKGLQFVVDAVNALQGSGEEIKAKTEALVGGLVLLGDVGLSILKFAGYLALATPLLVIAMIGAPILALALLTLGGAIMLTTKFLNKEQLEAVEMLGDVGKSILILMGTLALASFIAPFALKALVPTLLIAGAFALLSIALPPDRVENIEKVGKGLLQVALGLGATIAVLALISFIIVPALKGAVLAMFVIGIIGLGFAALERLKVIDNMEKAGKGLLFAAGAILGLGIALALFDIITPPLTVLISIVGVVVVVGALFALIGIFEKLIYKGARALTFAALSIFVVGLALLFFTKVVGANMGGEDLLNSFVPLLLIGALALAFGVAGIFKSQIIGGAAALMVGGIALIIIGVGVKFISKALGDSPFKQLGAIMALILGLGVVFAAAGIPVVAPFILLGAAALVVAGVALITIGAGLMVMSKVFDKAKPMLEPGADGKPGLVSLLRAIGDGMVMWPWEAAGILLGAGALTGAGIALITIGAGLTKFSKLIESGVNLGKLGSQISLMIGTLAVPFQKIGAGEVMQVLDADGNKTFVKFGGGGGGFFGLGASNPVAMGISSVLRMGKALSNIAGGVQNMANLKFPTGFDKDGKPTGYQTIGGDAFKKVITNTMMMVGSLAVPFAKIGMGGKQTIMGPNGEMTVDFGSPSPGGLLGFLKGGGAVQKGIKAVMSMGEALSNIALGVQDMALLKFPLGFDAEGKATGYRTFDAAAADQVTANTEMLVSALGGTFAKIGANPDANDGSWWGGKSTIEKGIEIVAGIGEPLLNLAKGVQAMADLKFPIYDKDGNITGYNTIKGVGDLKNKVGRNTQMLIQALTDTLTTIGKDNDGATSSWWQGSTAFEDGIEIVSMIGEPYKVLGESVKTIIDIVGKMDSKAFAGKMQDIIGVFTGDATMQGDFMTLSFKTAFVKQVGESFEKLGSSIPSITSALANFNAEQGRAFFNAFVGPVDEGDMANGYAQQNHMWKAIGSAMVQTKDSMPGITSAINEMDMDKLVESRKMFEALAVLGEGGDPGDILAQMGESLEEALQNLADMLSEFKGSVEEGVAAQSEATGGLTGAISKLNPMNAFRGGGNSGGGDSDDVVRAVKQLQTALISQGIKIKSSGGFFG